MGGLLYKNFFHYRIELIVLGVLQALCSLTVILLACTSNGQINATETMIMNSALAYGIIFFLTGFFESGLFSHDEKPAAMAFLISTPMGAKHHIQSKYISILLINLAVLFCCFLTDTVAVVIADDVAVSLGSVLLIIFSGNMIIEAFSVPFLVRFGSNHGVGVKGATLGVICAIVGLYVLFGDISMFMEDDFLESLARFFTQGNIVLMLGLFPFVSMGLYYLSYRISLLLFRKGAESYDG